MNLSRPTDTRLQSKISRGSFQALPPHFRADNFCLRRVLPRRITAALSKENGALRISRFIVNLLRVHTRCPTTRLGNLWDCSRVKSHWFGDVATGIIFRSLPRRLTSPIVKFHHVAPHFFALLHTPRTIEKYTPLLLNVLLVLYPSHFGVYRVFEKCVQGFKGLSLSINFTDTFPQASKLHLEVTAFSQIFLTRSDCLFFKYLCSGVINRLGHPKWNAQSGFSKRKTDR